MCLMPLMSQLTFHDNISWLSTVQDLLMSGLKISIHTSTIFLRLEHSMSKPKLLSTPYYKCLAGLAKSMRHINRYTQNVQIKQEISLQILCGLTSLL